ncbi:hypothetical protein Aple_086370 [Acrocarpospora pleiomorpha]|uniref:Uncharacterized protein n=1 Tax=Acrocarpospora pleiomorpha TaxID=90975 RepID=A0A5M3Y442_9ACTN|nr:hypothetical protein Aple_086370 [Acrocarpospora pleiomorpha]
MVAGSAAAAGDGTASRLNGSARAVTRTPSAFRVRCMKVLLLGEEYQDRTATPAGGNGGCAWRSGIKRDR